MLKPKLPQLTEKVKKASLYLCSLFRLHGYNGDELVTEGQLHIFANIVFRFYRQIQIICSTQYGKSLWVALAAIIVSCIQGKIIAIIAPSNDKAKIIMRYFIEHLGDNIIFSSQLEKNTRLERLRQEESKERIMLRNGGGIYVLSVQQRNLNKSIEAAMGAGAEVVIVDEACLITDDTEATIYRMIAGKTIKGKSDAFYCKIGNPFYSAQPYSHFKNDWDDPTVFKIFIDYLQAIKEGRYTDEFIERAKTKPLFEVLFGCEFPPEDTIDTSGYRQLLGSDSLKYFADVFCIEDKFKLGCDIGGGGDWNVYTARTGKKAFVVGKNRSKDTMVNVSEIIAYKSRFGVLDEDINIDDIGIGRGVSDRLKELGYNINGVNVGEAARDRETFSNLKAELCWEMANWVKGGGELDKIPEWIQLTWLKYKVNSDKQIKMEPKEDLKKRTKKSPDFAESLMLTFYEPQFVGLV